MTTVLARFKTYGKQPDELGKTEAHAVFAPERRDRQPGAKRRKTPT